MYLYNVPCCALYGGATHSCLRRLSSSARTCRSIVFLTASTEMVSPSRMSAIGPPTCASGTTWPITNPWELQEDRNRQKAPSGTGHVLGVGRRFCSPSTKSSVGHTGHVLAKTCTHNQTGGFEHFWHAWFHDLSIQLLARIKDAPNDAPGPPFGPRYLRTMTVFSPFLIDPPSTACTNSSSESNTRAFPVKPKPSFPVIFAIAPPGARLPVSTLMRTAFQNRVREGGSSGTDLM